MAQGVYGMDGLASLPRLHVLVIDPDADEAARVRQAVLAIEDDARVTTVTGLGAALAALDRPGVGCVVTELDLPDCRGLDVVRSLGAARPEVPVVVVTGAGSEEIAVAAMKLGAADYVRKRTAAPADLAAAVRCAAGRAVLSGLDDAGSGAATVASPPDGDFVAITPRMRHALLLVERAAHSRVPVLLEGETGTGKELLARAIHTRGPRRQSPFVVQNCGALSESLLESELFGHVRGAFTGAERDRAGLFVEAGTGTIFLDEVGEAPFSVQVKLLRVLQHGEVKAVGADRTHAVRARMVAATNRNLQAEVEAGRFRRDLYYRLAVFPIRIPPLRHRAAEVAPLAARFLERFEVEERRKTGGFAPEALDLMARHHWPGNVRELEHEVHRLVLTVANDQRIRPHHLAQSIRNAARRPAQSAPLATLLARIELALIRQRLDALPTKTAAARSLGITREALYGKLRRLGASTRGR
jgi:DNA-binding NtrC family response regulator